MTTSQEQIIGSSRQASAPNVRLHEKIVDVVQKRIIAGFDSGAE